MIEKDLVFLLKNAFLLTRTLAGSSEKTSPAPVSELYVDPRGFEPLTSRVQGGRSSQLSYRPDFALCSLWRKRASSGKPDYTCRSFSERRASRKLFKGQKSQPRYTYLLTFVLVRALLGYLESLEETLHPPELKADSII